MKSKNYFNLFFGIFFGCGTFVAKSLTRTPFGFLAMGKEYIVQKDDEPQMIAMYFYGAVIHKE